MLTTDGHFGYMRASLFMMNAMLFFSMSSFKLCKYNKFERDGMDVVYQENG